MANIKTVCLGTERSKTEQHQIEIYNNIYNEIYICISGDTIEHICLDKSTAIKLSKILRTEINKMYY